jgi:regulator of sigma E protease
MPLPLLILGALIVLSILVIVHELGHFFAAKKSGVLVEEFGIGLPPRAWGKKIGETIYSINWIPLGGFVKLHGEVGEEKIKYPNRAYVNKGALTRIWIALAGVLMNLLFAILCFSIVYTVTGIPKSRETGQVRIEEVISGSPSEEVGLAAGDIVKKVNGTEVKTSEEFISLIKTQVNQKVKLEIERSVNGEVKHLSFSPLAKEQIDNGEKVGRIGIAVLSKEVYTYYAPYWQRPLVGVKYGFEDAFNFSKLVMLGLGTMARQLAGGEIPQDVAGPVVIIAVTSEVAKAGIIPLINFAALISVNLAVLNIVPFPPLDGSRVGFVILEKIIGKKKVNKVEGSMHQVGMILFIILAVILTSREVPKLIQAGSVSKFIDTMMTK